MSSSPSSGLHRRFFSFPSPIVSLDASIRYRVRQLAKLKEFGDNVTQVPISRNLGPGGDLGRYVTQIYGRWPPSSSSGCRFVSAESGEGDHAMITNTGMALRLDATGFAASVRVSPSPGSVHITSHQLLNVPTCNPTGPRRGEFKRHAIYPLTPSSPF
jgi:hypothetical protein